MILHEKKHQSSRASVLEWWAVDRDSLTLAFCQVRMGEKFILRYVRWDKGQGAMETYPVHCDRGEAAINLLIGCREFHRHLPPCPAAIREIDTDQEAIPEYLLLGASGEPAEAIMHTVEPVFIAVFPDGPSMENPKHHFVSYRLGVSLPAAGWEYWRTDAWQEFVALSQHFVAAETEGSSKGASACQAILPVV
jgi:hypothetical protein